MTNRNEKIDKPSEAMKKMPDVPVCVLVQKSTVSTKAELPKLSGMGGVKEHIELRTPVQNTADSEKGWYQQLKDLGIKALQGLPKIVESTFDLVPGAILSVIEIVATGVGYLTYPLHQKDPKNILGMFSGKVLELNRAFFNYLQNTEVNLLIEEKLGFKLFTGSIWGTDQEFSKMEINVTNMMRLNALGHLSDSTMGAVFEAIELTVNERERNIYNEKYGKTLNHIEFAKLQETDAELKERKRCYQAAELVGTLTLLIGSGGGSGATAIKRLSKFSNYAKALNVPLAMAGAGAISEELSQYDKSKGLASIKIERLADALLSGTTQNLMFISGLNLANNLTIGVRSGIWFAGREGAVARSIRGLSVKQTEEKITRFTQALSKSDKLSHVVDITDGFGDLGKACAGLDAIWDYKKSVEFNFGNLISNPLNTLGRVGSLTLAAWDVKDFRGGSADVKSQVQKRSDLKLPAVSQLEQTLAEQVIEAPRLPNLHPNLRASTKQELYGSKFLGIKSADCRFYYLDNPEEISKVHLLAYEKRLRDSGYSEKEIQSKVKNKSKQKVLAFYDKKLDQYILPRAALLLNEEDRMAVVSIIRHELTHGAGGDEFLAFSDQAEFLRKRGYSFFLNDESTDFVTKKAIAGEIDIATKEEIKQLVEQNYDEQEQQELELFAVVSTNKDFKSATVDSQRNIEAHPFLPLSSEVGQAFNREINLILRNLFTNAKEQNGQGIDIFDSFFQHNFESEPFEIAVAISDDEFVKLQRDSKDNKLILVSAAVLKRIKECRSASIQAEELKTKDTFSLNIRTEEELAFAILHEVAEYKLNQLADGKNKLPNKIRELLADMFASVVLTRNGVNLGLNVFKTADSINQQRIITDEHPTDTLRDLLLQAMAFEQNRNLEILVGEKPNIRISEPLEAILLSFSRESIFKDILAQNKYYNVKTADHKIKILAETVAATKNDFLNSAVTEARNGNCARLMMYCEELKFELRKIKEESQFATQLMRENLNTLLDHPLKYVVETKNSEAVKIIIDFYKYVSVLFFPGMPLQALGSFAKYHTLLGRIIKCVNYNKLSEMHKLVTPLSEFIREDYAFLENFDIQNLMNQIDWPEFTVKKDGTPSWVILRNELDRTSFDMEVQNDLLRYIFYLGLENDPIFKKAMLKNPHVHALCVRKYVENLGTIQFVNNNSKVSRYKYSSDGKVIGVMSEDEFNLSKISWIATDREGIMNSFDDHNINLLYYVYRLFIFVEQSANAFAQIVQEEFNFVAEDRNQKILDHYHAIVKDLADRVYSEDLKNSTSFPTLFSTLRRGDSFFHYERFSILEKIKLCRYYELILIDPTISKEERLEVASKAFSPTLFDAIDKINLRSESEVVELAKQIEELINFFRTHGVETKSEEGASVLEILLFDLQCIGNAILGAEKISGNDYRRLSGKYYSLFNDNLIVKFAQSLEEDLLLLLEQPESSKEEIFYIYAMLASKNLISVENIEIIKKKIQEIINSLEKPQELAEVIALMYSSKISDELMEQLAKRMLEVSGRDDGTLEYHAEVMLVFEALLSENNTFTMENLAPICEQLRTRPELIQKIKTLLAQKLFTKGPIINRHALVSDLSLDYVKNNNALKECLSELLFSDLSDEATNKFVASFIEHKGELLKIWQFRAFELAQLKFNNYGLDCTAYLARIQNQLDLNTDSEKRNFAERVYQAFWSMPALIRQGLIKELKSISGRDHFETSLLELRNELGSMGDSEVSLFSLEIETFCRTYFEALAPNIREFVVNDFLIEFKKRKEQIKSLDDFCSFVENNLGPIEKIVLSRILVGSEKKAKIRSAPSYTAVAVQVSRILPQLSIALGTGNLEIIDIRSKDEIFYSVDIKSIDGKIYTLHIKHSGINGRINSGQQRFALMSLEILNIANEVTSQLNVRRSMRILPEQIQKAKAIVKTANERDSKYIQEFQEPLVFGEEFILLERHKNVSFRDFPENDTSQLKVKKDLASFILRSELLNMFCCNFIPNRTADNIFINGKRIIHTECKDILPPNITKEAYLTLRSILENVISKKITNYESFVIIFKDEIKKRKRQGENLDPYIYIIESSLNSLSAFGSYADQLDIEAILLEILDLEIEFITTDLSLELSTVVEPESKIETAVFPLADKYLKGDPLLPAEIKEIVSFIVNCWDSENPQAQKLARIMGENPNSVTLFIAYAGLLKHEMFIEATPKAIVGNTDKNTFLKITFVDDLLTIINSPLSHQRQAVDKLYEILDLLAKVRNYQEFLVIMQAEGRNFKPYDREQGRYSIRLSDSWRLHIKMISEGTEKFEILIEEMLPHDESIRSRYRDP